MRDDEQQRKHANINPAARRDRAGQPHDDLARDDEPTRRDRVKGYQDAALDPRDAGGIAE